MSGLSFTLRGLWYFRASYLGVLAGAALGAMVLLGAMMAGDSVNQTLRQVANARLGKVDAVFAGGDRFFRSALADDLTAHHAAETVAPVLIVKASVTAQRSGRALGNVQVVGVDGRFWHLGPRGSLHQEFADSVDAPQEQNFFVNEALARSLDLLANGNLISNQTLVLRFDKPGMIARDAPLAGKAAEVIALSGNVDRVCDEAQFGRFSLETTQMPQATVFVPLERLQQTLGLAAKANLLLLKANQGQSHTQMLDEITRSCTLADYGLTVAEVPLANSLEIRSSRIFFDRKVAEAIQQHFPATQPVVTYMANSIAANGKSIPYSMVTAVDATAAPFFPEDKKDGAVLNAWAADDLAAKPGDELTLTYYSLDGANRLVESNTRLTLAAVVPLTGLAADPRWMPDFPGVASAEKTADWDAGVPIDMKRIRDKDEAYWNAHRGTPKLFIPLQTGRELFANRWGEFTSLRLPASVASNDQVTAGLLEALNPAVA
ncbi:MAG: hypothetical protein WCJ66_10310, partial [Verrucomicrobiota bacterium]